MSPIANASQLRELHRMETASTALKLATSPRTRASRYSVAEAAPRAGISSVWPLADQSNTTQRPVYRESTVPSALRTLRSLVVVAMLVACACDSAPPAAPELSDQITAAMANAPFGTDRLPGAVIAVADGDQIVALEALGQQTLGAAPAPDPDGVSRIGSATKPFVATVVLQLVTEGALTLATDLGSLGTQLPGLDGVTVEQALGMTSGLHDLVDEQFIGEVIGAPTRAWTDRELAARGLAQDPDFAPGQGWGYSNTNYHVLAVAVETVTQTSIADQIATRISQPLGLVNTRLPAGGAGAITQPALVGSYQGDDTSAIDPSYAGAAGAMVSTVTELARWGRAFGRGDLITQAELRPANQPTQFGGSLGVPITYGYGTMRFGEWIGHSGDMLGYTSAVFYLPARDRTIVVLATGDFGRAFQMFSRVADAIEPDSLRAQTP